MTRPDEDDAWRSIVENYGERPDLGDLADPAEPRPAPPRDDDLPEEQLPSEPARAPYTDPDDRFVPPPPPPLPRPTPRRAAAWAGLMGSPLLMLIGVVFGISLPWVLDLALLAGFVGGFAYLVATMNRRPQDPWDDGSRV